MFQQKGRRMQLKDLYPDPDNPRKIGEWQLKALGKSMAEFGDLSGIVYNTRTRQLVGGHQRIRILEAIDPIDVVIMSAPCIDAMGTVALGTITTPLGKWTYREVDWPREKQCLANIAANQHGGEFDLEILKPMLIELDAGAIDMDLTGFSHIDLELMMTSVKTGPGEGEPSPGGEIKTCPNCGYELNKKKETA